MLKIEEVLLSPCLLCSICGNPHDRGDCNYIKITKHVPDSEIASRAKLTLPNFLQLQILTDGSYSVVTKSIIHKGTQFGPYQAAHTSTLNPAVEFPLKVYACEENANSEYFMDVNDENKCNWLVFVCAAEHEEEQNLICYQHKGEIFYVTIKDIEIGAELKVWYSPYYAQKINKNVLAVKTEIDPLKNIDINSLIKKQQKIMERKTWTCKFCSQMENNIVAFAKHILKHYTAQLKKMCEICTKTFGSKKSLAKHLKVVHNSEPPPKPPKRPEPPSIPPSKDIALGGPLLNDMFTDSTDLPPSDLNHFDVSIENPNMLLDSDNLIVETFLNDKDLDSFNFDIDDSPKHFVCDICLKQFTKVQLLIAHLKHHTGDFMCFKCLKVFCRKESLKTHFCNRKFVHKCELCNRSFGQRKYLSRHVLAVHKSKFACPNCSNTYYSNHELKEHNCSTLPNSSKEKFTCTLCEKVFYRHIYLKRHMKTHTNKKNAKSTSIICEVCGVRLESRNSAYLHMKKHKDPMFECEVCDKSFHRKDSLNAHLLRHRTTAPVECPTCQKKYTTKKILAEHMRIHSTEGLFSCSRCTQTFQRRHTLNKHTMFYHTEKKSPLDTFYYSCPVCNKSMKLRSSLLRHLRKMHPSSNIDATNIQPKPFIVLRDAALKNNVADSLQNELDLKINNLLNTDNNLDQLNKQAVDNLVKELDLSGKKEAPREVCLSIPDLSEADQEITLDRNAYILENGTIVQPQEDSDNIVIYVLGQTM